MMILFVFLVTTLVTCKPLQESEPEPTAHSSCFYKGKTYQPFQPFASEDCTRFCQCLKGKIGCVSMCPLVEVECTADEKIVTVFEPMVYEYATQAACSCPIPKCVSKYNAVGVTEENENDDDDFSQRHVMIYKYINE